MTDITMTVITKAVQILSLLAMAAVLSISVWGQHTGDPGDPRIAALVDRVHAIEASNLGERLARVEENQNMMRQLQMAQLGGIAGLLLDALRKRRRQ